MKLKEEIPMFTKMPEAGLTDAQFERVTELLDLVGPELTPDDPMLLDTLIRSLNDQADTMGMSWMRSNKKIVRGQVETALDVFR